MNNRINKNDFNAIIKNAKLLVNPNIYKFLFKLLYAIFFKVDENSNGVERLKKEIDKINQYWIIIEHRKISLEYNSDNLRNIIEFVTSQNVIYGGNILENILILIFSFIFEIKKENTFGKYLYDDIQVLKDENNDDFTKWMVKDDNTTSKRPIFKEDLGELLRNDIMDKQNKSNYLRSEIEQNPLYDFLSIIFSQKFKNHNFSKKFLNYLNKGIFNYDEKLSQRKIIKKDSTKIDSLMTQSNLDLISNMKYNDSKGGQIPIGKARKIDIKLVRSLFISVYIYYQNEFSPLMKYIKNDDKNSNLEIIPFVFDLSEAAIESNFAGIILSPLRIEPKVTEIKLVRNDLKENGFKECAITLLFNNKCIKKINFKNTYLKSLYIDFLNYQLGIFDNYSVEVLNLNNNHLKSDCIEYLSNILSHLRNLKKINLSSNPLKRGASSFLIMLKKLYREGKTELETLNLNDCQLDYISFYELGELVKSKYCKLKNLYLNENNIPSCSNFLKALKKNRSLKTLYLNSSGINNNDTNDLNNIISNSNIDYLYLYKNKITDFSQFLRIISRTKLIYKYNGKNEDNILLGNPFLSNLDLSKNECFNKNEDKIELLLNIINNTTLYSLDISGVLYGKVPKIFESEYPKNYKRKVETLRKVLEEEKKKYDKAISDINSNNVDIKKLNKTVDKNLVKEGNDEIINGIIDNGDSIYPIYLKKQAEELIEKNNNTNNNYFNININKENKNKVREKLVDYLRLKRAEKTIKKLEEIKDKKKLILI